MARTVEYHDGALQDFNASVDWYASRSQHAALGFVAAVDAAIEQVVLNPERFPRASRRSQYCRLTRYPFRIIFRVQGESITIIAIAHAKRSPGYWWRR